MKDKISVTVDKELLKAIDVLVQTGRFRNKSHVVEYGLSRLIKGEQDDE